MVNCHTKHALVAKVLISSKSHYFACLINVVQLDLPAVNSSATFNYKAKLKYANYSYKKILYLL
jgi:hypothetical protein